MTTDTTRQPAPVPCRGRFAPSPTGPLHFGSLVAALGSYLEARAHGGEWHVRIEDIDPPREVPGAADDILRTLEAFGLEWDGGVTWQSRHKEHYEAALQTLRDTDRIFDCGCTRREVRASTVPGLEGPIYPGTCRNGLPAGREPRTIRVRTTHEPVRIRDRFQGDVCHRLARDIGDFVLKRADGHYAYQLAVAVDDVRQGFTHVVRGADLLSSTPRQVYLQRLLGYEPPAYAHLPIAVNDDGRKLSKQTGARPLDRARPGREIWRALAFLRQDPPRTMIDADAATLREWALTHWSPAPLEGIETGPLPAV